MLFWKHHGLTRSPLSAILSVLLLVSFITAGARQAAADDNWQLAWEDNFDGAADSGPNTGNWSLFVGSGISADPSREVNYTDSRANSFLTGYGALDIRARREASCTLCWSTARLSTENHFALRGSGRVEARVKLPKGKGVWPGMTIFPADGAVPTKQIDVFDYLGVYESQIMGGTYHDRIRDVEASTIDADSWHVFSVVKKPDMIMFSVDGQEYLRTSRYLQYFNDPAYHLVLDFAIGPFGDNLPDSTTPSSPADMLVDYVRAYTLPGTAPTAGALVERDSGRCVDISGGATDNGTNVQLWGCNNTGAQYIVGGDDSSLRALGKCLDVASSGTADGTKVQLWDCNGTGAQKWVLRADGSLLNTNSDKCLSTGYGTTDGTQLQLGPCSSWTVAGLAIGVGPIIDRKAGKCVDLSSSNTTDGTKIQLWDCNGTGAQRVYGGPDGSLRILEKCLDVTTSGTANGTKVQLWECNGTSAQRWTNLPDGSIKNLNSGKCLRADGTAAGSQLMIWDCTEEAEWNTTHV